jgi:predicted TIM-barrel fold metal-dependent hydrolase
MIFDSHTHIFRTLHGTIATGPVTARAYGRVCVGDEEIQLLPPTCETTTFPAETLVAQMDRAGVDKAMLLQGPFYGDQNTEVLEAVARYPDRLAGAAYVDPWVRNGREAFAAIVASKGFRAVKLEFSVPTGLCGLHPEARLDSFDIAWFWARLEGRRLVTVVDMGAVGSRSYQTAAMRAIALTHPNLKIVVAHLGQIRPAVVADRDLLRQWQEQIDLGRLDNVWFDCASLATYCVEEGYPYPSVGQFLRRAIHRIGPAKVLWGSDVPGVLGQFTYPQLVELGSLHTGFLSGADRAMVLGRNALELYGSCNTKE